MKKDSILGERMQNIIEACAPLKVKVTMRRVKDKYYIHFDGSATYPKASDWGVYWISFDKYVKHLLVTNGFDATHLKSKSDCYTVAFIGTLFGFLKGSKNDL